MKPAFPMNGARGGEGGGCVDALSMQLWCNRHIATTTDSPGVRVKWEEEGVQASKCGRSHQKVCSGESEVVTPNALEIGCKSELEKRRQEGDKQPDHREWVGPKVPKQIPKARVSNQGLH